MATAVTVHDLEESHSSIQILELMLTMVEQPKWQVLLFIFEDGLSRLRDQYLAAMGGRADAGCPMDRKPRIAFACWDRLSCVNTDPYADLRIVHPLVAGQCRLHFQRAEHGRLGVREGYKKSVALRVQLVTTMVGNGDTDYASMLGEDPRVALPKRLDQAR
ncbi:MAG: hypothetical protein WB801_09140 [Candidatus Dormiibacterota bacterium]